MNSKTEEKKDYDSKNTLIERKLGVIMFKKITEKTS